MVEEQDTLVGSVRSGRYTGSLVVSPSVGSET